MEELEMERKTSLDLLAFGVAPEILVVKADLSCRVKVDEVCCSQATHDHIKATLVGLAPKYLTQIWRHHCTGHLSSSPLTAVAITHLNQTPQREHCHSIGHF